MLIASWLEEKKTNNLGIYVKGNATTDDEKSIMAFSKAFCHYKIPDELGGELFYFIVSDLIICLIEG